MNEREAAAQVAYELEAKTEFARIDGEPELESAYSEARDKALDYLFSFFDYLDDAVAFYDQYKSDKRSDNLRIK